MEPKRQMLRAAEEELAVVQARLREAQATLRSVNAKIAKLEADLNGAVAKKDKLVNDAATCEVQLARKLDGGYRVAVSFSRGFHDCLRQSWSLYCTLVKDSASAARRHAIYKHPYGLH